jgi:sensor histidine kinase regulating citrate/malate metabolism
VMEAVAEPVLAALLLGKAAQANERGVELVITPDTRIDDDVMPDGFEPRDLVTILGNLIDNAIDAAADGHPPRVFVTARADADELVFRVADTGHGVEDDAVRSVFRRGWSTKSGDRPSGRGLGLALVAQAAARHGGRVEVGRDVGAVFTVTLPLLREVKA